MDLVKPGRSQLDTRYANTQAFHIHAHMQYVKQGTKTPQNLNFQVTKSSRSTKGSVTSLPLQCHAPHVFYCPRGWTSLTKGPWKQIHACETIGMFCVQKCVQSKVRVNELELRNHSRYGPERITNICKNNNYVPCPDQHSSESWSSRSNMLWLAWHFIMAWDGKGRQAWRILQGRTVFKMCDDP